ncbi:unnamed protein product [Paramecium pentaurelia]|uniref:DNA replication complex GINS protein SLD5 n=1 Tax=Paramecium pentaurelia TaxID=43138 RepID=A0A8S1SC72_9CILI|nr:unnamed protein product [Paramecium pentaurelia]
MDIQDRNKLLLELKTSLFLPPFNEELYSTCTTDHQKSIREIQEIYKLRNDPELADKIKPIISLKIKDVERTKRVQLAYLMHRINKIQSQYFIDSGQLSNDHLDQLSKNEKDYYKFFDQLVKRYENDIETKVSQNIIPPSEVFIEVRVIKQIGNIITQDGDELDLEEGTQQLVKKSDVIKFLQEGSLVQI